MSEDCKSTTALFGIPCRVTPRIKIACTGFHTVLAILNKGELAFGIRNALVDTLNVLRLVTKWPYTLQPVFLGTFLFGTLEMHLVMHYRF